MILLLMGVVCFLAALRATSGRLRSSGGLSDVRGAGAAAWLAALAVLTLAQLWAGRDALDRYRFTLLGFRHRVVDLRGALQPRPATVSGDEASADVYVPGAGDATVVELRPTGSDTLEAVVARAVEDAAAVALVEEPGLLGARWSVLGSVPVDPRVSVSVSTQGGTWTVEWSTTPARVRFVDAEIPIPWVDQPVAVVRPPAGGEPVAVTLPPLEGSVVTRLRGVRPSVFQRTYPLADVLLEAAPDAALPPLGSFLFWQEGGLRLADLDSEVSLGGAGPDPGAGEDVAADPGAGEAPLWERRGGGRRLLVAGLPHRDWREPDLTLPERYGVRPLRSFRIGVNGPWLDVGLGSPEVHALDVAALRELRLPDGRDEAGRPVYRIRLTPGRNALARRSLVFDAAPSTFAAAGQAVFRLPEEPTDGEMHVLTPSGLARWETGRPLTLGAGDRALLVRVDGQGTSAAFWLVLLALFAMAGAVFLFRPMNGPVFALALTASGLACVRLLLGVGALASFPFVLEGHQIGLWLLPLLPWTLVTLAESTRRGPARPGLLGLGAWREWTFHVVYAVALVGLAQLLFPESAAKRLVLGAVPASVLTWWLAARSGWRPWAGAPERLARARREHPLLLHGWSLGFGLLLLRVVLEGAGWREQLTVGGTRIGVSVFYTPLTLVVLAGLLWLHGRRLRTAAGGPTLPRTAATALLEVGGFLAFALLAVSGWVSDFGIALVLLPGPLVLLALLGARFAGAVRPPPGGAEAASRRPARMAVLALSLPLLLFALVQVAPPLLRFAWGGDLQAADARMGEWNRNELLLLERGDPSALRMIGQRRSEALAVMRETMRSYTRGNLTGKGFLRGRVSGEIAETATREHAVSALLASQWGLPGTAGVAFLLLSLLPPVTSLRKRDTGGDDEGDAARERAGVAPGALATVAVPFAVLVVLSWVLPSPFNTVVVGLLVLAGLVVLLGPAFDVAEHLWWGDEGAAFSGGAAGGPAGVALPAGRALAAVALYTVAFAGLYMILANYGLTFFTGKNVYLLGLDSVGDALESLALLGLAALALGRESEARSPGRSGRPRPGTGAREGSADGVAVAARGAVGREGDAWWLDGEGEER